MSNEQAPLILDLKKRCVHACVSLKCRIIRDTARGVESPNGTANGMGVAWCPFSMSYLRCPTLVFL